VNGEAITLSEYRAELTRYQVAFGTNLASNWEKRVLNDLIDQVLLAQAAREAGFVWDEAALKARLGTLATQVGGTQVLVDWMKAHGYSEEDFRTALARSAAAAWMRDRIVSEVPEAAEQAHARQILLYNSSDANNVLSQLDNGTDFATLAKKYDPATGGDLGWFPRGYLTEPALEAAAFSLEPGKYSKVIETRLGYHILLVIERDPQHPLTTDARMTLQERVLREWLEKYRSQSDIQILLP
jgi:peptidyl-prolyl cis-trans isomerase C